ncbi:hypothetical protein JVT61DRAFT_3525 [Boletus reticuloceps]|nr:hypothetical protein JVT61DRAFT_3525 [Boletus reticuloceps]
MSQHDFNPKQAKWTDVETNAMLHYLHDHLGERGDGNFKTSTFSAAAQHIKHHHSSGKEKDAKSVKYKFSQMKSIYVVIKAWIDHTSGIHYDEINGADIRDEGSAKVFDKWASGKGHEKIKLFHNKGWGYYGLMKDIFPEGAATGGGSYRSTVAVPSAPSTTSPGHDELPINTVGASNPSNVSSHGVAYHLSTEDQHRSAIAAIPSPAHASNPLPVPSVSQGTSSVVSNTGSNKCSYAMLSPDETGTHSPSHLFSASQPRTKCSSLPPGSARKRSRTSASRVGAQEAQEVDWTHLIMVNTVNNAIHSLRDTLSIGFRDRLTVVGDATKALYLIPSFSSDMDKVFAMGEFFAANENIASMFLSLREEDREACVNHLYTKHCSLPVAGGPSS